MPWYLVSTRPRQEVAAEENLRSLPVETFLPRLRQQRIIRRRKQMVTSPLFPGYVFVRCDLDRHYRAVSFARGVSRLVVFGDAPAVVDDAVVESIVSRMEDGAVQVRPAPLRPGDRVRVTTGPLEGLEAIFEREMTDQQRVVLLFQRLSYQARIVVDLDEVANL